MNTTNGTTNAESLERAAAGLEFLRLSLSAGPGPISHMLAVELGVNQHHLSLTNDTLHLLPAPRPPFTTLFEIEAGQRHIFRSFDVGSARPPILSAYFSYTGEGFAAIFEVRGDCLRQLELGIRRGRLGSSLWRNAVRTWRNSCVQLTQSGIGIHMIRSLHTCCGLPTPG